MAIILLKSLLLNLGDLGDLGDLGEITVEKIILSDEMEWEVEFRNGLPFIIESLNFNIYKGQVENDDKLTSLIIESILPYTTVIDYVQFESYELTLDASLFAEIEIIVDSNEAPSEQCDLNICISDAISIDNESGEIIVDENQSSLFKQGYLKNKKGIFVPQPLSEMFPYLKKSIANTNN